jgi:adenylylsulfate kinase-like enzyme
MSDVITYPLSAAIELCEQLDKGTPETDAAEVVLSPLEGDQWVRADVARKLERERDEAREKIERQSDRIRYLEGATNHACGTPLSVALKDRDEAREKYATEATEHMLAVNKICNERDEARENLDQEIKFHHRTHSELVKANCKLLDIEYDKLKS